MFRYLIYFKNKGETQEDSVSSTIKIKSKSWLIQLSQFFLISILGKHIY